MEFNTNLKLTQWLTWTQTTLRVLWKVMGIKLTIKLDQTLAKVNNNCSSNKHNHPKSNKVNQAKWTNKNSLKRSFWVKTQRIPPVRQPLNVSTKCLHPIRNSPLKASLTSLASTFLRSNWKTWLMKCTNPNSSTTPYANRKTCLI